MDHGPRYACAQIGCLSVRMFVVTTPVLPHFVLLLSIDCFDCVIVEGRNGCMSVEGGRTIVLKEYERVECRVGKVKISY